jgi:hypothetical protein
MFILRLQPQSGIDKYKSIRWLLKKAKRLGLKAISVSEEADNHINIKEDDHDSTKHEHL